MIYGDRIRFRAPEKSDLPIFVEWMNDPEVIEGLNMYLPISMANEETWFQNMQKRPEREKPYIIETIKDGNWVAIGNIGFHEINDVARSGELGIVIGAKEYWNQGYGTESIKLLIRFGFETLNLNRICLQVFETNLGAIRCYEKSGMIQEGRLRKAHFANNEYLDILYLSILRNEWINQQGNK